jgi:hypothetical protein
MMVAPDGRSSEGFMSDREADRRDKRGAFFSSNLSGYKTGAEQSARAEKRAEEHRKQNETHSTVTDENGNQHNIKNSDIAGSIDPNSIESIDPYGYKVLNSDGSVYKNVVQGHNISFKDGNSFNLNIENDNASLDPYLTNLTAHSIWFKPDNDYIVDGKEYLHGKAYELASGQRWYHPVDGIAIPNRKGANGYVYKMVNGVKVDISAAMGGYVLWTVRSDVNMIQQYKALIGQPIRGGWKDKEWVYSWVSAYNDNQWVELWKYSNLNIAEK